MNWLNNKERYGALSIALHWLMALLIAAVYACIVLREKFPKGSAIAKNLETWHSMLGLFVLVLLVLRIAAQFFGTPPQLQPTMPKWQNYIAQSMHLALYAFMFAMPLVGWLLLSAEGEDIPYFGLHLPALISQSKSSAEWIKEVHEVGGIIGYILIGIHAFAALYHHYFLRDNCLWHMLPWRAK
ncbi:MAG: cytochrome b [Burkholderiales bacterium]|nr:cytochrome b [Burkholderiales bacterium]